MKARAVSIAAFMMLLGCGPGGFGGTEGAQEEDTGDSTEVTTAPPPDMPTEPPGTSTSTSTTESESATDFVPPGDPPPDTSCDPWMQDCPEGEKCTPYASSGGSWDAHKCVPILGNQGVGEPCHYDGVVDATDDCDETGFCFQVDEDGVGTCHAYCTGTPDAPECPPGSYCGLSGDGTLIPCIPSCDPILQDCREGTACYWGGANFLCVFQGGDGIPAGQPCGFINDCYSGLICVVAAALPSCDGASCCTAFCELDRGDVQCAGLPGTVCSAFAEEPLPGYENLGVCVAPQ